MNPFDVSGRNHWSALMLTEIVAAMALFLAVIASVWFILGTLG
ncbi:MAG: hypothetical protein P1T08_13565 [Acidimicrobiia bacterium]|nr:hypothetical protein [Acidimicrobiia bacterium]